MGQIEQIFDGWKNSIFKDKEVEAFAVNRLKICYGCEFKDDKLYVKCSICGCPLKKLARSRNAKCKKGKWK